MTYKAKIYTVTGGFLVLAATAFVFGFGKLEARNKELSAQVATQEQALEQLQQEQRSYEQGQRDVASLQAKPVQPEELFSKDTRVVNEIRTLESLGRTYALQMTLQISGTAKDAQKIQSSAQLMAVPYTMTLTGSFDKVLAFLDHMEHLSFISPVKTVAITAQPGSLVKAIITADFYIKQ